MDTIAVHLWGRNIIWKDEWILVDEDFVVKNPALLNEFYRTEYFCELLRRDSKTTSSNKNPTVFR